MVTITTATAITTMATTTATEADAVGPKHTVIPAKAGTQAT